MFINAKGASKAYVDEQTSNITHLVVAAADSVYTLKADIICDGINDDLDINTAIARLSDIGGTIELLDGNYSLGMPVYPKDYTRIKGQGFGTVLKIADKVSASLATNADAGQKNISINTAGFRVGMDVTIWDDAHTGYEGGESNRITSITPGSPGTITMLNNLTNAYTTAGNALMFSAYNAIDCDAKTGIGIESLQIDGNKANNTAGNFDTWQNGVRLVNCADSRIHALKIINCCMAGIMLGHNGEAETTLDGCEDIFVSDNLIRDCSLNAIHNHGTKYSQFSNNNLSDGTQAVLYFTESHYNNANNNLMRDGTLGLQILSCVGNSIVGGCINKCGSSIQETNAGGGTVSNVNSFVGIVGIESTAEQFKVQTSGNAYVGNVTYKGTKGFNITASRNVIAGNLINAATGDNGILENGGDVLVLVGNLISNKTSSSGTALSLNNADNVIVGHNVVEAADSNKIAQAGTTTGTVLDSNITL